MEWPSSRGSDGDAAGAFADSNPWTSPLPQASSSSSRNSNDSPPSESGINGQVNGKTPLPANPLYQGSPELGSPPEGSTSRPKPDNGHMNPEATRPTLFRLTSGSLNGLLHGLDSLSFPNASQESLSTEDTSPHGTRRSLDELRRLSIKGKGRAMDDDASPYDLLGKKSLEKTRPRGREALLHPVEEGDTLQRLALLYGCTVPAIRSANKMWPKDPIYPRKTLYIPLDACKQPPSKEVEFVQKSGEDEVQVYFRQSKGPATQSFSGMTGKSSTMSTSGRSRSDSLRLEALAEMPRALTPYRDSEQSSNADSPFSSQRSSFSHTRQASASSHFNYLSSTTSEYGDSDDGLGQQPAYIGNADASAPRSRMASSSAASGTSGSPDEAPPVTRSLHKTLQIVQIPGTNIITSSPSRTQGKSPLISVDNLEDSGAAASHEAVVSVSSTSLGTPIPSGDRLSTLSGTPANLRLRPRSPFDPGIAVDSPNLNDPSGVPTKPPLRARKISKEAVPLSSTSKKGTTSLPGSIGKYITSAGAGLVSSLMGDRNTSNSGWLATSELETEMEMAREYQTRHQHRMSISSERTLHARNRSSASLRNQQPSSNGTSASATSARRAPSLFDT